MPRFYLSNLRTTWPFERQEAVIAARFPNWARGAVYRDEVPQRKRKQVSEDDLIERATMLRPTTRRGGMLYVASLAVLALTPGDLADVIAFVRARGDTLESLEDRTLIDENSEAFHIEAALDAFKSAVRRVGDYGKPGGLVSGERRAAAAQAACETVRERWGMPSEMWTIKALAEEAGVSRPTLYRYLGDRSAAQRKYMVAQALGERNRARRKRV